MKSTIVLVHGAFADSSSWDSLTPALTAAGHQVIAYANPLRGVAADAVGLTDLVRSIDGPVLLVGHSYGGAVMTNVSVDAGNITGLVYIAAFALDASESAADVAGSVPGSSLGDTLHPVPLTGGGTDLYISPDRYHQQFCADLSDEQAARMAVSQRPITEAALGEKSGPAPLWRTTPSWFVFGDQDLNIPVQVHRNMAQRAAANSTLEISGASHVVAMSHPDDTANLILQAAEHHPQ